MSGARTIVLSGAGSGIGRAAARRLVGDGFHVTAVGRRKEPLDHLGAEADRGGLRGSFPRASTRRWVTGQIIWPNGGVVLGR